jgi:peptidoglycan-associated lipoprotein
MKNNIITLSKLAALGTTLVLAAGCSTDNFYQNSPLGGPGSGGQASIPVAAPPPPVQTQPKETTGMASNATNGVISAIAETQPARKEDRTSLDSDKVYFNFARSDIKSPGQSRLDAVAFFLRGNPKVSLRIEGNCDERGTEEFNRELGVRRATVSRDYLISQGIDPARIQTLSRGKDNPAVTGEGGKDRALNRRDEFVVLTKDKIL